MLRLPTTRLYQIYQVSLSLEGKEKTSGALLRSRFKILQYTNWRHFLNGLSIKKSQWVHLLLKEKSTVQWHTRNIGCQSSMLQTQCWLHMFCGHSMQIVSWLGQWGRGEREVSLLHYGENVPHRLLQALSIKILNILTFLNSTTTSFRCLLIVCKVKNTITSYS